MMASNRLPLVVFALLVVSTSAFGQSIREVLNAVQERRLALVQRRAVEAELKRHAALTANPDEQDPPALDPVGDEDLIDWGDGLERFPTEEKIKQLPFRKVVEKLNRASRELDYLKRFYVNLDAYGTSKMVIQAPSLVNGNSWLEAQGLGMMPSVGDFDEANWRQKIVMLASSVEQLRALQWPMEACEFMAHGAPSGSVPIADVDLTIPLATPRSGVQMAGESSLEVKYWAKLYSWLSLGQPGYFDTELGGLRGMRTMVSPTGGGTQNNLPNGSILLYKRMAAGAAVPWLGAEVYPQHKATLPFHFSKWYESASNTFERGEFIVGTSGVGTTQEVETVEAQVRARWGLPLLSVEGHYDSNRGYVFEWQDTNDPFFILGMYFDIDMEAICLPSFTQIQRSAERHVLSLVETSPGAVDTSPGRHLFTVDLGRGLRDRNQTAALTCRADGFGSMEFAGSLSAFKVIYETDIDEYPEPIVEDPFSDDDEEDLFTSEVLAATGWSEKGSYVAAWTAPRLRHVFGTDITVDIEYVHDYCKILRFYWTKEITVPVDSVDAPVTFSATAFKTVVVENSAGLSEAVFPEIPPRLHIDDAGLHWDIEKEIDLNSSPEEIVVKAGSQEGGNDVGTRTVVVTSSTSVQETIVQLGVTTVVNTQYSGGNRFSIDPRLAQVTQGGRSVVFGYASPGAIKDLQNVEFEPRPMLVSRTYSGQEWPLDGAVLTWNADGTLASQKRFLDGDELSVQQTWNNRKCTSLYKFGTEEYRSATQEYTDTLDEVSYGLGGSTTVVKYYGPETASPWLLKEVKYPSGYQQNFETTLGDDAQVVKVLEGWGTNHDAGTKTITTTNRGGGLVSQEVTSLPGDVLLSSVTGSEHIAWGAPKKLTGRYNEVSDLAWQATGRAAGSPLTQKSPLNVTSGVSGYDVQGRPTGIHTGFALYTPSYADPLKASLSGPSGSVSSTFDQFGDAMVFKDTRGVGQEVDLTPGSAHLKVDGRTADLNTNAAGEVTGVKTGLGQRGARVEFSVETVAGYPQKKLCRTDYARQQDDQDAFQVRTFFDDRDRAIRRETPAINGGVVVETWTYNDVGRSVTYSPGPAASFKPITQTITNTDNGTIVTITNGGVNHSRSTTKIEGSKVVSIKEIFDGAHGGTAAWSTVSHIETDPATRITTAQPWDLTAAAATSTQPVPSESTTQTTGTGATDDTQEVTRTKGRITRIHGTRAGAEFDLNDWQYVNDRLVHVKGTIGDREVGLEINAKGQVSRVFGPGFDKAMELIGTTGFQFKITDAVQNTEQVTSFSAAGDMTAVAGDVSEPVSASTADLGGGETRTVLNQNLTVTKTVTGAVRSKAYAGGAMADTTHTFTADNLPMGGTTGVESVVWDFSQFVSANKIFGYYAGAGTVEQEFYGSGPRRYVKAPSDDRTFTHLRQEEATTVHGPNSIWANASSARSQDNKGRYSGLVVAVPGSDGYSDQRWHNASGLPYKVTSGDVTATYEYDDVTGELESITRGVLTTSIIRDSLGRVTGYNTVNSSGEGFGYGSGYNNRNLRTTRTASNGVSWTELAYDNRQRLTDASLSTGAGLHYDYDGRNNRDSGGGPVIFTNNGVDQVTGRTLGERGYGVRGRVAPGSVVRVFHPQAGPQGELVTTEPVTGVYAAYWAASGGFGAGVTRVELLVRGTLAGAGTGGTNAVADQNVWVVLPASAEAYEYDGAGRMGADSMWTYSWNAIGRLVGMTRKAGTSVDPTLTDEVLTFGYDADGHRTLKTRTRSYQNAPNKVETSKVYWSKWMPVCEEISIDGGTASRRWFVWGQDVSGGWEGAGGIGGLLAIREESGRTLLPVHDGLGNITAVVNALNGDTVARYDYAPFGELLAESGDVNACPFRYQSKYYDAETGLSYFGHRYYSAKLGRWISRDPLGEEGGFNLYGYCGNDPVNKWDYLGLDTVSELESRFFLPDGTPFASKFLILSSDQLRDKVKNAYVLSAFRQGGNILLAEQAGLAAWSSVYKPAWEATQSDSRRAADQYNSAFNAYYTPGGSFVAGLPNRLKDEGSTVVAFLGTQLLNTEAMGFRYEAGARYDWRTNSFGVVWNTTDVERGDQLLAAGLMFVGGFGDDFLRGAKIGWAARSSEWVDDTIDASRWARKSAPTRPSQVVLNNVVGNEWDDYVAATKLRLLDEAGLLGRQERLLTPDIIGRNYVKPDFTIWNSRGTVAAYGDAKVLKDGIVKFDAQAKGLVEWAATTESKKLIYYVPWRTQAHTNLINYASLRGVGIQFVIVP